MTTKTPYLGKASKVTKPKLGTYSVTNRVTRLQGRVQAASAQEACEALGWMIGECHVYRVDDRGRMVPCTQ